MKSKLFEYLYYKYHLVPLFEKVYGKTHLREMGVNYTTSALRYFINNYLESPNQTDSKKKHIIQNYVNNVMNNKNMPIKTNSRNPETMEPIPMKYINDTVPDKPEVSKYDYLYALLTEYLNRVYSKCINSTGSYEYQNEPIYRTENRIKELILELNKQIKESSNLTVQNKDLDISEYIDNIIHKFHSDHLKC